ncbi:MAG: hypothetical protein QNJ32_18230 [Xenococcaceae cyanobacterium MO_167.B27]|nr:hypothetical protein [Xenococcaceae cyanobacterium MO_167.B27]
MNNDKELPIALDEVKLPEKLPPLMIVAFTRPDLLQEVIVGVREQTLLPQQIIAFVDGARKPQDEPLIKQCIELLETLSDIVPIKIVARPENMGRSPKGNLNVILGLHEVLSEYDSLVYLEDDIVPNPCFYDRMCRLLEAYRDRKEIFSISAYGSFIEEFEQPESDFILSKRVFSWGYGLWSDRWHDINLVNQLPPYNLFGSFANIPLTVETKKTMTYQFWLEKNLKTDWVIAVTLGALYYNKIHLIPKTSFVKNIGFGHSESRNYNKGKDSVWVNARHDPSAYPNSLPSSLKLSPDLDRSLHGKELAEYLESRKNMWLNWADTWRLSQNYSDFESKLLFLKFFMARMPILLKRWRSGLKI